MRISPSLYGVLLAALIGLGACAMPDKSKPAMPSLYDRLGGIQAITAVVDDFVGNVGADTRINAKFATANIPRLKTRLVEQICAGAGGPCTYSGRDMRTAHAGMGITNAEFDALVEDMVKSLTKFKVPPQEQKELLGMLGPMRKDIVSR
ncbi:hemin transporter [Cupriavidus sp. SK-4]|uniref:group I truncated hemoglobin n=1 Tax=Cupriavidus sp. SK-4 TaxID=574750 RepID=UPI00045294DA|nr:group 1 truncated hemoglobin [Cupriavidus sp. SK-4]EYS98315.1 hemin transporter [Cupriavidus sp. SK-4]